MHVGKIEAAKNPQSALARLIPYLYPSKPASAWVLGLVVLYTFGLIGPYLMGVAIDRLLRTKRSVGLVRISVTMLIVYVLYNLLQAVSGRLMAGVSARAHAPARGSLVARATLAGFLLRSESRGRPAEPPDQRHRRHQPGHLAERDHPGRELAVDGRHRGGDVRANYWLALASLSVVPIMFWFTRLWPATRARASAISVKRDLGQLNGVMEEAIMANASPHAFRRKEAAIAAFRGGNQQVFKAGVYANSYALLLMPITSVLWQPVRDRAGRAWRLAGSVGLGERASSRPSSADGQSLFSRLPNRQLVQL